MPVLLARGVYTSYHRSNMRFDSRVPQPNRPGYAVVALLSDFVSVSPRGLASAPTRFSLSVNGQLLGHFALPAYVRTISTFLLGRLDNDPRRSISRVYGFECVETPNLDRGA